MASNSVELGFVEKRAPWKLLSKFFPSKVGGYPSWLRLNNLPDRSNLLCVNCSKPLNFLMQVYAPIIDIDYAFHRTLYIFMCIGGKCNKLFNNENIIILRNQLPRQNEFYSFDPPVYNEKSSSDPSAKKYQELCNVCGCKSSIKCINCSDLKYCCEDHRICDWECNHKNTCGKETDDGTKRKKTVNKFILPEYELVTETEELPVTAPEKSDQEKMKDFQQFMQSSRAPKEMQDMPLDDLDNVMKRSDKAFNKFKKRVELEPEQVLRYQRGEEPLWVSSEHIPSPSDIPDCSCGSKRVFEFQVMPQLLNHLFLDTIQDSIDWGNLAIYTCSKSCESGTENYVKEFVWKQDFSNDLGK